MRSFSLKNGFTFFLKANILLVLFILIFIVNITEWRYDGSILVITFITFAEAFIILLSILACIKPKENKKNNINTREQSKEWIGASIAFVFLSLFSLLFLGANIPYPSTLIFFMLVSNAMVTAYSILFHPISLGLYKANVFQEKNTMFDYTFKYIIIYLSGISYYVQVTLFKLPLLLNKLIVIVFTLFLLWQFFMVVGIFDK